MSKPLRILILEDNAADAELNIHELRDAGFDPQWQRVESEAEYLAALDTAPELILADYSLPKFDGLRALKALRDRRLDIPFILVSGMAGEEIAVEAMKQGATDYLLKDQIARLGAAVERAMEEKRLRAVSRRAETALRDSEERLRTLGDNIPGGAIYQLVAQPGARARYTYMSGGIEKLLGIPAGSVMADPEAFWQFIVEEDRARFAEAQERSAREMTLFDCEFRQRTTGGEIKWLHARSTPRRLADGSLLWDGVVTDITERKLAEEQVQASLREKEVLLREVHHRVKNNLQIVSSLLNLQIRRLTDPEMLKIFASTRNRVRAMAAVHERLYESGDFAKVDLAAHLGSLARMLAHAHAPTGATVRPVLRLDPVTVDLNTAVPLSLIANELITNALKYGFGEDREGTLTLALRTDGGYHELSIADDGPGFPAAIDPATSRTLGLRLVRDLTRQIRGELKIASTASGTSVAVRWPAQPAATIPTLTESQQP